MNEEILKLLVEMDVCTVSDNISDEIDREYEFKLGNEIIVDDKTINGIKKFFGATRVFLFHYNDDKDDDFSLIIDFKYKGGKK